MTNWLDVAVAGAVVFAILVAIEVAVQRAERARHRAWVRWMNREIDDGNEAAREREAKNAQS